eukprot:CAMPEP_0115017768 /NCGR_PEP_ID=MMETSP0216-20121206/28337_1 /TAXON_ID=223996 /ORGANISM="Protocruzia adherens, Strain Boccale" /LENGTH=236 /DNA_ID=CAMNT_0002388695 /DNA_START=44 /DNA_END=754 /DNA_ORIENTATION=-
MPRDYYKAVDDHDYVPMDADKELSMGFIRKVYGILAAQLTFTTAFCAWATLSEAVQQFMLENFALFICSCVLAIVICFALSCCPQNGRIVPRNYILLGLFTLCESYMVGALCAMTDPTIVLTAAVLTVGVTVALTLYACFTKTDFTVLGGMTWILCMVMLMFGIMLFFMHSSLLNTIYCVLGVLLYGLFLIIDTQLIVGGQKTYRLGYDDYILGAMMLYIDIIGMFVYILRLLRGE